MIKQKSSYLSDFDVILMIKQMTRSEKLSNWIALSEPSSLIMVTPRRRMVIMKTKRRSSPVPLHLKIERNNVSRDSTFLKSNASPRSLEIVLRHRRQLQMPLNLREEEETIHSLSAT